MNLPAGRTINIRCLATALVIITCSLAYTMDHDDSPRITTAPRDQKVMEGKIASFFCKASGNPAPEVYWKRTGKRASMIKARHKIFNMPHGSVLRINPTKWKKDETMIECIAENGIGQAATATARLHIYSEHEEPKGFPRLLESPEMRSVEKDRNFILKCSATGDPDPIVYWLKDNIPVDMSDKRIQVLPGGSLSIRIGQGSDEGKYECVAENLHGTVHSYPANLYIRIRRVPPHFSVQIQNKEISLGGSVNVTCVVVGAPMPHVRWKHGDIELTPENNIPIGKNVLRLENVRQSGTYKCIGSSELGNVEQEINVTVMDIEARRRRSKRIIDGDLPTPINVTSKATGSDSFKVQWSLPSNAELSQILV